MTRERVAAGFGVLGLILLGWGSYLGLFVAPPDRYMGDVQRIMYVHVPFAWLALVVFTLAFVYAVLFLVRRSWRWDALHEASLELGVLYTFLLCVQGALWGKPTWGVYWAWDPRLTTVAVMLLSFAGILSLRHFLDDPIRRASWSATATILAAANVPIVYYSVRWWNSLHQAAELARDGELLDGGAPAPQRVWTARLDRRPPHGPFVDCGRSPSSRHGAAAAG